VPVSVYLCTSVYLVLNVLLSLRSTSLIINSRAGLNFTSKRSCSRHTLLVRCLSFILSCLTCRYTKDSRHAQQGAQWRDPGQTKATCTHKHVRKHKTTTHTHTRTCAHARTRAHTHSKLITHTHTHTNTTVHTPGHKTWTYTHKSAHTPDPQAACDIHAWLV